MNKKFNPLLKRKQKRELIPMEGNEVRFLPTQFWTRILMLSISGSVLFGLIYACLARIDEVVVATGELQGLGAERPIKAPISGILTEIKIKEGQRVAKGTLLAKFDTKILLEKEKGLKAKLEGLEKIYQTENNIYKRISSLESAGAISMLDVLKQQNKLKEIEVSISQVNTTLREINLEKKNFHLHAPIEGKVFNLIPASTGYFASNGELLMEIVPAGELEAKVFFNNSDIGSISTKMKANVRVDAYPFTQFGSIPGEIRSIGDEVLEPDSIYPFMRFPAYVRLDNQFLEKKGTKYEIRSGQSVSANIIVRDKPVISLLTDIFEKAFDSLRGIKSNKF